MMTNGSYRRVIVTRFLPLAGLVMVAAPVCAEPMPEGLALPLNRKRGDGTLLPCAHEA